MKTIFKYPLSISDEQLIEMPIGAEILSLQVQNNIPCIWAMIEEFEVEMIDRTFMMYGTGHSFYNRNYEKYDDKPFIGTFQVHSGTLVFHVFEEKII